MKKKFSFIKPFVGDTRLAGTGLYHWQFSLRKAKNEFRNI